MSVGIIDVGTNTVRLLITDGRGLGERDMVITRLGQGVDASRVLAPAAMERTIDAIAERAERCRARAIDDVRIIATSAVRDAANRDEFLARVAAATGITPDVLSGEQEATLSFRGATLETPEDGPFLVCDIGGGSTELIVGADAIERAVSLDIGSVRLTERHLRADPVDEAERARARADAERAIDATGSWPRAGVLIGVAGTVTTLAALVLGLETYDMRAVHHASLTRAQVAEWASRLAAMTNQERRALAVMPPGREEVIVAGVTIFEVVMDRFGFERALVSETDILDGAAAELLAR